MGGYYKIYDAGMPAEFEFPSPLEVTGVSYGSKLFTIGSRSSKFPSSLEVSRGAY